MMLDFGFYNLDCMEGMRQFPDKYFDLAIVDPPYGDGGEWKRTDKQRFGGVFDKYRETAFTEKFTERRLPDRRNVGGEVRKKLFRGTWRRKRNISTNFSASHVIRLYGGELLRTSSDTLFPDMAQNKRPGKLFNGDVRIRVDIVHC